MAKNAKQRRKRPSSVQRLSRQRLIEGLPWPDGTRIRFARPEDSDQFSELLSLANEEIEQAHIDGLAEDRCGQWLLDGLSQGGRAMIEPLVRGAMSGQLQDGALSPADGR